MVLCALCIVAAVSRAAGPLSLADLDLLVPAGDSDHRRAPYPSHRVLAGDEVRIVAIVRVGSLRLVRPRAAFSTDAPVKSRRDEPRSGGTFVGPSGPRLFAGSATFTTPGSYRLTVRVDHLGGSEATEETYRIEVAPAAARREPGRTSTPTSTPDRTPIAAPTAAAAESFAPTRAPAVAPAATPRPVAPRTGVAGPDLAMVERLRFALRQIARRGSCEACPSLVERVDALAAAIRSAEDPARCLTEYEAVVAEIARLQRGER